MSTSLADQLRQLALPETSYESDKKKRASLLFDPSEAARLDRDAFFDIGVDGLKGLVALEPAFEKFTKTLFDLSSRFLARTVESKEVNKKLDKNIQKFLRLLSPYLLLKQSHKALEWLIYRYHIHSFNVDDLMALILPYHETKIFVRVLQLINLNATNASHWTWLSKLKYQGVHLPKSILINHALSESSFLRFICDTTTKTISENKKHDCANKLGTLTTFYASTLANVFARSEFNNHHMSVVLPSLMKALTSDLPDFKASGYIIAGQLVTSNQVLRDLLDKLIQILLNEEDTVLEKERALLILLIFQTQVPTPDLPPNSINKLSPFTKDLSSLAAEGILVGPFVIKLMETCLETILNNGEDIIEAQILSYTAATEVQCDLDHCKALIRLIDSKYNELEEKVKNSKSEDSSMLMWMKELMNGTMDKHKIMLDGDVHDKKCLELREKWKAADELALQESALLDLMKKCQGENKESAWMQLRPLLLNKIKHSNVFEALCKVAPFYDNLVLLLCINKLISPKNSEEDKKLILNKISKSRFGENNPHIQEIQGLYCKKSDDADAGSLLDTIESYFLKRQKKSDNPIEFEPWLATLQELKQLDFVPEKSETWSFGLKVLLAALPENFNATYALQSMTVLSSLKDRKLKTRFQILKSLIEYTKLGQKIQFKWYDLSARESEVWLKVRVLEYILEGIHNDRDFRQEYEMLLDEFSKACFCGQREFVRLLTAVCCGVPSDPDQNPDYRISPTFQIYSLHVSWNQLKNRDEAVCDAVKPELDLVLCYLLITMSNESAAIRKASLHVLQELANIFKDGQSNGNDVLLERLLLRFEEISLDANQVSVALYCSLSPSESVQATLPQSSVSHLTTARNKLIKMITAEDTPAYVTLGILQLFDSINSPEIIEELINLAERSLNTSRNSERSRMILANFWSRINETTVQVFDKDVLWDLATKSIKHGKCDGLSPAVSFLKCITQEVFEKLPANRKFQLVECMIETRSITESPSVASAIASVMKKVCLDCDTILPIVNQMMSLFSSTQKRRESMKYIQLTIIASKEWKNGISLLELIQSKKRLFNSNVLIQPLFAILKFCLDQEEQNSFEYAKQLVLGCLLDCCKKLSTDENVNENNLNVELVVQCLRASPNPQTHHHALMLLSYLSAIIPKQVIHNVMAIFTFMGTSVARMDDEHSVKVVTQVVEAVVPVLVKAISDEHENNQIVKAEILRVFVWAVKDIPQHRRKPLLLQLLNTLQPETSLWIFLLLLLENHVVQGDVNKLEGSAVPMNHCLGLQLCLAASPKIVLDSIVKIINYLMSLPIENMNKEGRLQSVQVQGTKKKKSDGLFDVESHTPKQLRHFCYTTLTFLNLLLADNNLIAQVGEQTATENLEDVLKETIASVMKYTPTVKKQLDKLQTKFWKAMTHQCYEILDKFILLVPNEMLLSIIKNLLNHPMKGLRRKALDLLNGFLQQDHQDFTHDEKDSLMRLMEPINAIINSIGEEVEQAEVFLQQTALLTLKLMAKVLSCESIDTFKKILINICNILKSKKLEGPLLGSLMLAIAELVTALKAHSVSELPVFMPLMLKEFSKNSSPKRFNELGLNSITLAIHRVVDVMPNFLSPYLDGILYSVCTVSVKTHAADKPDLLKKLLQIRQKLASNVEHRILIPAIRKCYDRLIDSAEYEATGPLFSTLSTSFVACPDVTKIVPELTQLFISALNFRSDCEVNLRDVEMEDVDKVEQNVIEALVPFVLKLSESLFKPLYYQIFHWASEHRDRFITFFRLSHSLAESLKGLFVLFAGRFLHKAATLLDATNLSKTEKDWFGDSEKGEKKSIALLESILKTLHSVFLYDSTESSNFLNKDKFEVLLHPLVDQLENPLGGIDELENRTVTLLTPCLAQMALATDDTLWKSLNYEILLKTKSILPQVRIGALDTIVAIAGKLGEDYMMLLPETIGYLAELLEDENEKVENAMKEAIQKMEDVLGQPIREYFQ